MVRRQLTHFRWRARVLDPLVSIVDVAQTMLRDPSALPETDQDLLPELEDFLRQLVTAAAANLPALPGHMTSPPRTGPSTPASPRPPAGASRGPDHTGPFHTS